jgi:phosphatidylserine/phosphatidylglycerophosphate/cardiolipin synthase-like enzyme
MSLTSRGFFCLFALGLAGSSALACSGSSDTANGKGDASTTSPPAEAGTAASAEGGDASSSDAGLPALIVEPDQGMTPIYDFVQSATTSIDMTMYELQDTAFTSLLVTAAGKGVAVRVILDQNLEMQPNQAAYTTLSATSGVTVHWANTTFQATHQKTITIDGKVSAIMSLNLDAEEYPTSRDFAVIEDDPNDVAAIEATFAADLQNASITPANGDDLVWSPTNSQTTLLGLLNGAKTSLLVENEEMGDYAVVNALKSAASRGVNVEVVMENSEDYQAEFVELEQGGVKLVVYQHSKLYIHAKAIVADYGTSAAKVFVGSENFSNASLTENRELGIVTTNAAIMGGIHTTLESDFAGGKTYVPDAGAPHDSGTTPPEDSGTAAQDSGRSGDDAGTDATADGAGGAGDADAGADGPS